MTQPDTGSGGGGNEYFVQTVADAAACSSYMGRVCEWNRLDSASGAVAARLTTSVLSGVGSLVRFHSDFGLPESPNNPFLRSLLSRVSSPWALPTCPPMSNGIYYSVVSHLLDF